MLDKILKKLKEASKFSYNPKFTILCSDKHGLNWELLGNYSNPMDCLQAWCGFCTSSCGFGEILEIRCDGVRVNLN